MAKNVTISTIVKDFYENCPQAEGEVSFIEYAGDLCIDVYYIQGFGIRYSYHLHSEIEYWENADFMEQYLPKFIPLTEANYRKNYAALLRGRMDAFQISRSELANLTGLNEATLYRILTCKCAPTSYTTYILNHNLQNSEIDNWRLV